MYSVRRTVSHCKTSEHVYAEVCTKWDDEKQEWVGDFQEPQTIECGECGNEDVEVRDLP